MKNMYYPVLFSVLFFMSPLVQAVSFDCTKATSSNEKLICTDEELSALDDLLAQVYNRSKIRTGNIEKLEADAVKQWQSREHDCLGDKECLYKWYRQRIYDVSYWPILYPVN